MAVPESSLGPAAGHPGADARPGASSSSVASAHPASARHAARGSYAGLAALATVVCLALPVAFVTLYFQRDHAFSMSEVDQRYAVAFVSDFNVRGAPNYPYLVDHEWDETHWMWPLRPLRVLLTVDPWASYERLVAISLLMTAVLPLACIALLWRAQLLPCLAVFASQYYVTASLLHPAYGRGFFVAWGVLFLTLPLHAPTRRVAAVPILLFALLGSVSHVSGVVVIGYAAFLAFYARLVRQDRRLATAYGVCALVVATVWGGLMLATPEYLGWKLSRHIVESHQASGRILQDPLFVARLFTFGHIDDLFTRHFVAVPVVPVVLLVLAALARRHGWAVLRSHAALACLVPILVQGVGGAFTEHYLSKHALTFLLVVYVATWLLFALLEEWPRVRAVTMAGLVAVPSYVAFRTVERLDPEGDFLVTHPPPKGVVEGDCLRYDAAAYELHRGETDWQYALLLDARGYGPEPRIAEDGVRYCRGGG